LCKQGLSKISVLALNSDKNKTRMITILAIALLYVMNFIYLFCTKQGGVNWVFPSMLRTRLAVATTLFQQWSPQCPGWQIGMGAPSLAHATPSPMLAQISATNNTFFIKSPY
jgi:hypothetical protein